VTGPPAHRRWMIPARPVPASMVQSRKEAPVTTHTYEIRVIGSLGPATREAFAEMAVEVEPCITVLSGDLDQRGLHALLDRVRALGLELVEIKQAQPPA
jgi:hypothetical protein